MKHLDDPGEPLDVVDLLADDESRSADRPGDRDEGDRRRTRRSLVVVVVGVVVVTVVAASLVFGGSGDDEDVGIAAPTTRAGTPTTARRDASTPPSSLRVERLPFLGALGGRIAFTVGSDVYTLDRGAGQEARRIVLPEGGQVVDANGRALLVVQRNGAYVVDTTGGIHAFANPAAFAAADDPGFWRVDEHVLTAVGFDAAAVELPGESEPLGAIRDGFLLRPDAQGALATWTPGSDAAPIPGTESATLVALHPDRIAWYAPCDDGACRLRVTDIETQRTVDVPNALSLFGRDRAFGRFSPDGDRLALLVDGANRSELVVADLTAGTISVREPLDESPVPIADPSYIRPLPFDFTPDGDVLLVAAGTGRRRDLVAVNLVDGTREASGGLHGTTSVVALDARPSAPSTPLAEGVVAAFDAVIAGLDERFAVVIDLETATFRRYELPVPAPGATDGAELVSWSPSLVALHGGFVASNGSNAFWLPLDGDLVDLGPAQVVVGSADREQAWTFMLRTDGAYDVVRVDGRTGERRAERVVFSVPQVVVGEYFVRTVPAGFALPGGIELWHNATGETRSLGASGAEYAFAATRRHVLWQDCSARVQVRCAVRAIDVESGEAALIDAPVDGYVPPSAAANDVVYLPSFDGGSLYRFDAASGETVAVPGSNQVVTLVALPSGGVIFETSDGISYWASDLLAPVPVGSGSLAGYAAVAAL